MKKHFFPEIFLIFVIFAFNAFGDESEKPEYAYVDNGAIRLGVDLESGGSVFYFSKSVNRRNLLNHFDRGRFIQQSFYGDKDGSYWGEQEWAWNPVQGGDYKGRPAQLADLACTTNTIYCKTIPRHWASGDEITNSVMEQWISLNEEVAHIRYRFSYNGDHSHNPADQEMPAVFADYALDRLIFYNGDRPWKNDNMTVVVPGWPNEYYKRTEERSAYVNKENRGLGVYTPGTPDITCYRFKGPSGPAGSGCSYFAPIRKFAITKDLRLEYDVFITIGKIDEIRERFYEIRSERQSLNLKR